MEHGGPTALIVPIVGLGVPLALLLAALARRDWTADGGRARAGWRPLACSLLLYALAFNLIFFLQELFLVLPKALTPGLDPILYHNNHDWTGEHPLERLFQGTGAAAIFVAGVAAALLAHYRPSRRPALQLFMIWLAFSGLFQSIPQFATAAMGGGSDTALALDYLALGNAGETAFAILWLALLPIAGWWVSRLFLALPGGGRLGNLTDILVFAPIAAIPLILLFRVPREAVEVILPPVLVTLVGLLWVCGLAAHAGGRASGPGRAPAALAWPIAGCVLLLLFFHLVLRPGVPF